LAAQEEDPGAQEAERPLSLVSRRVSKGALIYYALVLPAIIAEVAFAVVIASTPPALLVQAGTATGSVIAIGIQLLPWIFIAGSLYAVVFLRPSLLITFLIGSFLVAVSIASGDLVFGRQLNLEATVVIVVVATFLALAGFNYGRGLKLLEGRVPDVTSSGPLGYNVLGVALESVVPFAAALALVVLVQGIVRALELQALHLPAPLSELASLYLQTRIGAVFTTLFVAGATIWVMRQFLEPLILHFTLNAADARKELLAEIMPTTRSVRRIARYRPSAGVGWGVLMVTYCTGLMVALAIFVPPEQFVRDLLATVALGSPSPSRPELLIQYAAHNLVVTINILFARSQTYIRQIITLLWG
jgi:hypothetical protein